MKLAKINVTNLTPGNDEHIKHVVKNKHGGKEVTILHRMGGEVDYLVEDKTK